MNSTFNIWVNRSGAIFQKFEPFSDIPREINLRNIQAIQEEFPFFKGSERYKSGSDVYYKVVTVSALGVIKTVINNK